ncbi:MAG: GTP cyclohydrolase [Parcubacteria group bacterium GW2011_GWA2_56_21]|nr:MAG: GTP cyclohydrolase [Parcubacteria group bacterium GW2011_GWA2_56_21]
MESRVESQTTPATFTNEAGPIPIQWGAPNPAQRGPIIATPRNPAHRNAIGVHAGGYAIYRGIAVATGKLQSNHVGDLTDTAPSDRLGPHPQWTDDAKIVSLDPWGHLVGESFGEYLARDYAIWPTIAVTRAHVDVPEIRAAIAAGRMRCDGDVVLQSGNVRVMKAAIDPVWYLPGIAARFGVSETDLRRSLHKQTGGYPELVDRPDLKIFLPPIGGTTIYCFGDPAKLGDGKTPLACRVHDECNGSDVFGSDICTCRPYLAHGIEVCIEMAQKGGVGLIVYNRKEGRALGEVIKLLVYNARKRQEGGDTAANYFLRTECIAGVRDMRSQALMPDVLHWLGIRKIDQFVSMSDEKYDAILQSGIEVGERVCLPYGLVPADAQVELAAKIAAGYFTTDTTQRPQLKEVKGREL